MASVPPSETAAAGGAVKTDWLSRHGVDGQALRLVLGCSATLVTIAFAVGVRPEQYVAPVGKAFAVGLLGLGLACAVWLLARPRSAARSPHPRTYIAATLCSAAIFLWAPALAAGAYDGEIGPTRTAVDNLSVWIPIVLLLVSVGLAAASRRRRGQAVAWAVCTILAFILLLCAVLIVGVDPYYGA